MSISLWTRQRQQNNQEGREPTLLAFGFTVIGFVLLLVLCVAAMAGLPVFGYFGWAFAGIAGVLAWLLTRTRRQAGAMLLTVRQRWFGRIVRAARWIFSGFLAMWLGFIIWLAVCPGGADAPGKASTDLIRVITWNIHCGQDDGPPWQQFDWSARKHALRAAIHQARPDVLCVQEARPQQVAFLEETLPGHRRVGGGRDDGKAAGEHCAIWFDRQRFDELACNTFWLEEPIDQPRQGNALDVKRICTWVRLRDRVNGRTLRVYNTHLYLTEAPRRTAASVILSQMAAGDPTDAIVLTADFNASPGVTSRQLFLESGLADSAERAGKPAGAPTFQLYGIGLWCIDGILVSHHWRVHNHMVLAVKPGNTFPSDHFALLADLGLHN
jgi:endonuclease/exonuclease/phosphatase family metal-dependent hydrolase